MTPSRSAPAAGRSRLLVASGLTKIYGGARAVDEVDFELAAGEIHALVGENGAGKSTLIKMFGGAVTPDAGEVTLDGRPLPSGDPLAVRLRGLSIVYQEFALVPELTVAENIWLGRERGRPFLRRGEMLRAVQARARRAGHAGQRGRAGRWPERRRSSRWSRSRARWRSTHAC